MKPIRKFVRSIAQFFNADTSRPQRRPFRKAFLGLETLEVREVLSASLNGTEATLLSHHEGYWVGEVDIPGTTISATTINDIYVDTQTEEVTVYAQVRIGDNVVSPVQVGPGESAVLPDGSILDFHPNAVYLNGSGEELMEADGTGEWWVKHPVLADEGYVNVEVEAQEYGGVYVEGELLDDGSIRIGGTDPETQASGFNVREVNIDQDPPTYTVTRYRPANIDPAAGEIDLTPVPDPNGTFTMQCTTGVGALDGSVRGCPSEPEAPDNNDEVRVGYEILQVTPNGIITWANTDGITQEEFDAIELPQGWFKNQPREAVADGASFANSPGVAPGEFVEEDLYGHSWQHVATIVNANEPLDEDELLTANTIVKSHELTYDAGSTLSILISPEGEPYVLVSRDAGRTSDTPTIPEGWELVEYTLTEELVVQLPNPTTNIRADNEDSFQGPVPELAELLNGDDPSDDDAVILTTPDGVEFVRTPDEYFESLPDWPYEPQYVEIDGLRQAYVDEGPEDGPVVLLLHGQPSWSYLYRDMIPVLADAGYRVIAMDHIGMGRSDKPIDVDYYSFENHTYRLEQFIQELGLEDINLFAQDWGSIIGLHVAGLNPDLFATITIGNGSLPVFPEEFQPFPEVENRDEILPIPSPYAAIPDQQVPFYDEDGNLLVPREDNSYFGNWMTYAMKGEFFQASETVEAMTWFDLPAEEEAAYDAPFPSRIYMAGPRSFPSLINDLPGVNQRSFVGLQSYKSPFLTIWGSNDPGAQGTLEAQQFFIDNVPGAEGQPHTRISEASHFLQDDQGEEIANQLVEFYKANGIEPADPNEPEILSAYLGAVDVRFPRQLENVSGADQAIGDDGMPIVLSVQVDASTLDPEDFEITTEPGAKTVPSAVTLAPAEEDDELRTILLTGPLGSENDLPVSVEIVGSVLSVDGEELQGLTSEVTTNENGPSLVLALVDPAETDADGNETTPARIQMTWQGGVTGRFGTSIGLKELLKIWIIDENGDAHRPVGFEDLGDNDNHLVLLVPEGVTPVSVEVEAGTLYDPTNQPNPDTSVEVTGTINLEDEPDRTLRDVLRLRRGIGFGPFSDARERGGNGVGNTPNGRFGLLTRLVDRDADEDEGRDKADSGRPVRLPGKPRHGGRRR
ncbi:MAG: haloalkane dehalogenase [Gemmataceae bacterium]